MGNEISEFSSEQDDAATFPPLVLIVEALLWPTTAQKTTCKISLEEIVPDTARSSAKTSGRERSPSPRTEASPRPKESPRPRSESPRPSTRSNTGGGGNESKFVGEISNSSLPSMPMVLAR
jgi:hypothetical protein